MGFHLILSNLAYDLVREEHALHANLSPQEDPLEQNLIKKISIINYLSHTPLKETLRRQG